MLFYDDTYGEFYEIGEAELDNLRPDFEECQYYHLYKRHNSGNVWYIAQQGAPTWWTSSICMARIYSADEALKKASAGEFYICLAHF